MSGGPTKSPIHLVRTSDNGGCGDSCACHCHSEVDDIPPGHIDGCRFADPDYTPPDFAEKVIEDLIGRTHETLRDLGEKPS